MKRACVIGWPIEHSRSPLIHGYWLAKYGIEGTYTKVAVRPEELGTFLDSLSAQGLAGCNVTVPHKEESFRRADVKDHSAVAVGAANTLWLDEGKLCCANTDTYGYMAHLEKSAPGWSATGGSVSVLGAGGAARAIIYGFLAAGVAEVRLFNRSRTRAEEIVQHFGSRVKAFDWSDREARSRDAAVLVNTTTVGMKGAGDLGIGFKGFNPSCVVSDIVYVPLKTAFLKEAEVHGLRTVDGLGMLLHQAVPGFEKWFGVRPEVDDVLFARIAADIGA